MADRFFPNEMPDYIPETPSVESAAVAASDSLTKLLHFLIEPSPKAQESSFGPQRCSKYLNSLAFDHLSDGVFLLHCFLEILKETWVGKGKRVGDYTLYTGALGTAFLLFKAYQVTGDKNDLSLCSDIIEACDTASRGSGRVTFICGRAGVCALGAVVAHYKGDQQLCHQYLAQFKEIKLSKDLPDELLYGRAGFLWASSFLNKNIGKETISSTRMEVKRIDLFTGAMELLVFALTLAKAAKVFGSEEFLQAAIDAGEVVWNRGLLKRVGVCHGISGNAYVFLSLYQLTEGIMHGGDRPYSLFEGIGCMAYLFLDMTEPSQARFPSYV
ncbi:LanC-like protein GCR2 [Sesamum angolense]|uniref:LanC-like protein GCR2 n=1 Tax=Sesamum angolense TaxID=2727404 RepID=A0AAE1W5D7_9LAMI|nr:LanC-like protein GCR2 [Sesamum angolense]